MSIALVPAPALTPPVRLPAPPVRRRFLYSVDIYEQMIKFGILTEDDRVELIRGEIVEKMSIGDPHAACVKKSSRFFHRSVGDRVVVGVQDPVRLLDSVPEPDISILGWREDYYRSSTPRPADVLLLIEVSDSSLDEDRDVKGSLYAENGIADYWILNLVDGCLEVRRGPRADGIYGEVVIYRRGQSVAPLFDPALVIAVDDLL